MPISSVTDFSSEDWWTGIKQTVKQESSASTGDRHGGRKRLQTQSFAYGVFPANHVKTISISPVPKELAKGTVLVMQNAAQVWRRCRVVEPAGWMSKKIKVHYIGCELTRRFCSVAVLGDRIRVAVGRHAQMGRVDAAKFEAHCRGYRFD